MEKENKTKLAGIIASAALLVVGVIIERRAACPRGSCCWFISCLTSSLATMCWLRRQRLWRMARRWTNFLMAIATLGALSIGFMPGADNQFPRRCS